MQVWGRDEYPRLSETLQSGEGRVDTDSFAAAGVMFDFLSASAGAKTREDILKLLDRAARHFGFDCFAISGIPMPNERIDPYFMLNGWPQEWYARYLANNYVHIDPIIHVSKIQDRAFVWSEALRGQELGRQSRRIMNEATEFKMKDGYSVPLHTVGGFQAIVSFGAEKVELSSPARGALHIISIYAHNAMRNLIVQKASLLDRGALRITAREREIIQWCAAGKTALEMAEILGRSHRTIQNQIVSIQRKLNVVNGAQMIAESFRLGILR